MTPASAASLLLNLEGVSLALFVVALRHLGTAHRCLGEGAGRSKEADMMASNTPDETDPICGMAAESRQAASRSERDGKTYYFCSTACKSRFDSRREPEAHLCCRRTTRVVRVLGDRS